MKNRIVLVLCFITQIIFAQNVQWACEVLDCSQKYLNEKYSSIQACGVPNAYLKRPKASSNSFVMGCIEETNKETTQEAFIQLKYCTPKLISQVSILENSGPGSITKVLLFDTANKEHIVYTGTAKDISAPKRILNIQFPTTDYKVASVKIISMPSKVSSWNCIDAVGISNLKHPYTIDIPIENLGPKINSKYEEIAPLVSPDGTLLFFTRENDPNNKGYNKREDDQDIWFSKLDSSGEWTEAKNVGFPLNNTSYNRVISVTPDGNTLLLNGKYTATGRFRGPGLSISNKTKNGWEIPEDIIIKDFENKNKYIDFCMANDKKHLIISMEDKSSIGERDLYISFINKNGHWSKPKNLGKTINSKGDDVTPFLASDGVSLYFSTDGRKGFGDMDIYKSKRLDDSWKNWSEPENLGSSINTNDWDTYFTISAKGDYAYLVRYEDSYGGSDIYRIKLKEESKPNPVVLIYGSVINAKTREPIEAKIIYELLSNGKEVGTAISESDKGNYKIILPYGKKYGFRAVAEGYYAINENIDVSDLKTYEEIQKDIKMVPIEVGEIIRLNNIFFEFGKSELKSASFPELDRVVVLMKDNAIEIEMAGHTDNIGSEEANLKLSTERAKSVVAYLISKGIEPSRLIAKGYGENKPITTNDNEEGKQQNRRVEFTILKK